MNEDLPIGDLIGLLPNKEDLRWQRGVPSLYMFENEGSTEGVGIAVLAELGPSLEKEAYADRAPEVVERIIAKL